MAKTVSWKWGGKTYRGTVIRETKNLYMLEHIMVKPKKLKEEVMALPGAYVVNSPKPGEFCNNCMHYSNNYCLKFNKRSSTIWLVCSMEEGKS